MSDDIAAQTARYLLDTKSVLFDAREPFKYTSGNIGPVYVDCRRPLSFPQARKFMMDAAADMLRVEIGADNIDVIAGAETAGIPYAAMIAERLEKPNVYIRKKPKGHGRMSQIEGHFEESETPRVVLIEDLQNFGHSKQIFVEALRAAGAVIEDFFVLFDYGIRPTVAHENKQMELRQHNLCNWWDVVKAARDGNYFDEETLQSVEAYLNDSESWVTQHEADAAV